MRTIKMANYSIPNFGVRFIKSFVWLVCTVFFGLSLPIVLVWFVVLLTGENFPSELFEQFIKSGSIMFFATAVVASVTLDYILSEKFSNNWNWNIFMLNNWNLLEIFSFVFFPLLILLCCVILFYIPYFLPDVVEFERLLTIQCYILLTIFFYSFLVKFYAFK